MRGPVTVGGPPVTAAHPTSPRQASASPRRRCTHSLNHPSASYSFDRSLPFVPAKRPRNGTERPKRSFRAGQAAARAPALLCSAPAVPRTETDTQRARACVSAYRGWPTRSSPRRHPRGAGRVAGQTDKRL